MTDKGGVWRTIGGRRVFIKDGQSLTDAMRESGKFVDSKKVDKVGIDQKNKPMMPKQVLNMVSNTEFGVKRQGRVMKQ